MQIQTAESLITAIGESGLFSPADVDAIAAELTPFGDDTPAMLKHLVATDLVPVYQLRKIVHGKTDELFVGPFVVLDKLGEGGMGKVFKVHDTRGDRLAALKVVRPNLLSNKVVRRRYEREVKAALSLSHPNIASAYEAGEVGGRCYLAMEFVDGIDLARLVRTFGLLPVPEACEYLRQAALGLQHAHERGFVHRDVKPSNIVVGGERHHPDATEPAFVKILDMGLIRPIAFEDTPPDGDLTRLGTVVGTPDYMAPEQAKNSRTVDPRSDLYSLGATFYFLLTGKPPFPAGGPVEKILRHQVDPPPPLQAARPDVPDELARIVARLMAKKPADRFASAAEVAAALTPLTLFTHWTEPVQPEPPASAAAGDGLTADTLSPEKVVPPPSTTDGPRPDGGNPAPGFVSPADQTPAPRKGMLPIRPPAAAPRRPARRLGLSIGQAVLLAAAAAVAFAAGVATWAVFGR